MPWRTAPAWPERPPPRDRAHDVVLAEPVDDVERLADDHLQGRAGEVVAHDLAVDRELAGAGLEPDAGDGVLAAAGGVGAALRVELGLLRLGRGSDADGRAEPGEAGQAFAESQPWAASCVEFLRFMAAMSSGCRLLAGMRVLAALVDVELAQHVAAERALAGPCA